MQENNITKTKVHLSRSRKNLVLLANHAYQIANQNPQSTPLNLASKQANKYNRFQFVFDPAQGFEPQQDLFIKLFGNDAQTVFEQLCAEHPFGVEIWVNPKNGSEQPLAERQGILAATSIFNGAKLLLDDLFVDQKEFIAAYFVDAQKETYQTRLKTKQQRIFNNIKIKYQETLATINALYNTTNPLPADKKAELKAIKKAIQSFQRYTVAQITSFKMFDSKEPTERDFKQIYKSLSIYEQKQPVYHFYKVDAEQKPSADDSMLTNIFKRDILSIDIQAVEKDYHIKTADIHFHKRNYTLTSVQTTLKAISDRKIEIEKNTSLEHSETVTQQQIHIYEPQATATSHSPDFLLSNSALVEEGHYEETAAQENQLRINFFNARHGSVAPNQLYEKDSKLIDRHESTYRTFLNMEQHLQQLRTVIVENILSPIKLLPAETIKPLSRAISHELTQYLHNHFFQNLDQITPNDKKSFFEQAEKIASDQCHLTEAQFKTLQAALTEEQVQAKIINVKNIHTHLITGTGAGSFPNKQCFQFRDARIAQYATWIEEGGYIYMSNGVNGARYLDGREKSKGNNAVALIELFKEINKKDPFPAIPTKISSLLKSYDQNLKTLKHSTKNYLGYTQQHTATKLKHDVLLQEINQLKEKLSNIKQPGSPIDNAGIKKLTTDISEKEKLLASLKTDLKLNKNLLTASRFLCKKTEKELFKSARKLNKEIYNFTQAESIGSSLSHRAFSLAQKLFNEKNTAQVREWKLAKNNGLLQLLVQLIAQNIEIFSSSGCKSANDRELLLAMLVSELSKIMDDPKLLTEERLQELLHNAQKAYATHISREQTALDHSAIPKTNEGLLPYTEEYFDQQTKLSDTKLSSTQAKYVPKDKAAKEGSTPDGYQPDTYSTDYLRQEHAYREKHLNPLKEHNEDFWLSFTPVRAQQEFDAFKSQKSHHASENQHFGATSIKDHAQFETLAAHKRAKGSKSLKANKMQELALDSQENTDSQIYNFWLKTSPSSSMNKITKSLYLFTQERGLTLNERMESLDAVLAEVKMGSAQCHLPSSIVKKLQNKLECRRFELVAELELAELQFVRSQQSNNASTLTFTDTKNYERLKRFIDHIQHLVVQHSSQNLGAGWKKISNLLENQQQDKSLANLLSILEELRNIATLCRNDWTNYFAEKGLFAQANKRPLWLRELYTLLDQDPNLYYSSQHVWLNIGSSSESDIGPYQNLRQELNATLNPKPALEDATASLEEMQQALTN